MQSAKVKDMYTATAVADNDDNDQIASSSMSRLESTSKDASLNSSKQYIRQNSSLNSSVSNVSSPELVSQVKQLDSLLLTNKKRLDEEAISPPRKSRKGDDDDELAIELEELARSEQMLRKELELFQSGYYTMSDNEDEDSKQNESTRERYSDAYLYNNGHDSVHTPLADKDTASYETNDDDSLLEVLSHESGDSGSMSIPYLLRRRKESGYPTQQRNSTTDNIMPSIDRVDSSQSSAGNATSEQRQLFSTSRPPLPQSPDFIPKSSLPSSTKQSPQNSRASVNARETVSPTFIYQTKAATHIFPSRVDSPPVSTTFPPGRSPSPGIYKTPRTTSRGDQYSEKRHEVLTAGSAAYDGDNDHTPRSRASSISNDDGSRDYQILASLPISPDENNIVYDLENGYKEQSNRRYDNDDVVSFGLNTTSTGTEVTPIPKYSTPSQQQMSNMSGITWSGDGDDLPIHRNLSYTSSEDAYLQALHGVSTASSADEQDLGSRHGRNGSSSVVGNHAFTRGIINALERDDLNKKLWTGKDYNLRNEQNLFDVGNSPTPKVSNLKSLFTKQNSFDEVATKVEDSDNTKKSVHRGLSTASDESYLIDDSASSQPSAKSDDYESEQEAERIAAEEALEWISSMRESHDEAEDVGFEFRDDEAEEVGFEFRDDDTPIQANTSMASGSMGQVLFNEAQEKVVVPTNIALVPSPSSKSRKYIQIGANGEVLPRQGGSPLKLPPEESATAANTHQVYTVNSDTSELGHSEDGSDQDKKKRKRCLLWVLICCCLVLFIAAIVAIPVVMRLNDQDEDQLSSASSTGVSDVPVSTASSAPSQSPTVEEFKIIGLSTDSPTRDSKQERTFSPTTTIVSEPTPSPSTDIPTASIGPFDLVTSAPTLGLATSANPTIYTEIASDRPSNEPSVATVLATTPPTRSPTPAPTTVEFENEELYNLLRSVSFDDGAALRDTSSPQYAAYEWLESNENLESYTDERKVQRYSLATTYYSLGGSGWSNQAQWLDNDDECSWYSRASRGVCDGDGNIVRLQLFYNNLSGSLPPEIALLSNSLQYFAVSGGPDNKVEGTLPTEYGRLSELREFRVQMNDIRGTIPSEYSSWSDLSWIDLSYNKLTGNFDSVIGSLGSLRLMNLANNDFSGPIPSNISRASGLSLLNLDDNSFSGSVPSSIGELQELITFSANNNALRLLPAELSQMAQLQTLNLYNNLLGGTLPTEIGSMARLRSLHLGLNDFTGRLPSEIGNLIRLTDRLDVSFNRFSGRLPSEIGNFEGRLRVLNLRGNLFTGALPSSFESLVGLTTLYIDENRISGSIPEEVCNTFNMTMPSFYADCNDVECPCCTHCCTIERGCECRYEGTEMNFLCY